MLSLYGTLGVSACFFFCLVGLPIFVPGFVVGNVRTVVL